VVASGHKKARRTFTSTHARVMPSVSAKYESMDQMRWWRFHISISREKGTEMTMNYPFSPELGFLDLRLEEL
jgi:hypothetical protein